MFNPDLSVLADVLHARWAEEGFPEKARETLERGLLQAKTIFGVHRPADLQVWGGCKIFIDAADHALHPHARLTPESLLSAARDIFVVHAYCSPGLVTSRVTDLGPPSESYNKLIQKLVAGMHPLEQLAVLEGHDE